MSFLLEQPTAAVAPVPARMRRGEEAGQGPGAAAVAAVEVDGLEVRYGARRALGEISLTVPAGQFLALTGPSGSGKSTLALALCGLIREGRETDRGCTMLTAAVLRGRVAVFGADTRDLPVHLLARQAGIVFQDPATQLFHGTVEDEVAFAPRNLGLPEEEVSRRVALAFDAVGIRPLAGRPTLSLSAGQRQRLAIAAALSLEPRLLVLDEPAANLDRQGVDLLVSTLRRLHRAHGLTIVLIEHRLEAFLPLADRLVLLQRGRLAADGAPQEVLSVGRRRVELGLLRAASASSSSRSSGAAGQALPAPAARQEEGSVPPQLVRLERVTVAYGRRRILHELHLDLYPGQFAALVGPNGSGKSTLARVLAGAQRPQAGKVRWGRAWRRLPPGRRAGLLFQNTACQLLLDTVEEEVAFAPENFGLDVARCGQFALSAAGLRELRGRPTSALSVGEQQRTALAAVLAALPALLILDEPTVGQDWGHLRRLMACLRRLARGGTAVLLITHDEHLVRRFARRVIRLEQGRLTEEGDSQQQEEATT
jgi:energy-coupling factor transport system ATP-binding protein